MDEEKNDGSDAIKASKDSLLTEYQVINQWRNSVVNSDYIMTSIFLPVSIATFFSYYLINNSYRPIQWLFCGASIFLVLFWRIYAHYLDRNILCIYPRIYKLEEILNLRFTRDYLTRKFTKESSPPPLSVIERRIEEFKKWPRYIKLSIYPSKQNRGHAFLNIIALIIIISELLIIRLLN